MRPELVARARGLATHFFARSQLEDVAQLGGLESVARALSKSGHLLVPPAEGPPAPALEQAWRRTAARHLAVLARWAGPGEPVLEVFFADQERRIIRAMLRGAVEGAGADARLKGLLPTPGLPERALKELARQATASAVISHLLVLGRPEADALLPFTREAEPALFSMELALLRAWAARAGRAARRGDANLRAFVAEQLDGLLLVFALLLAGGPKDVEAATCFVEGGRQLTKEAFVAGAAAPTRGDAATSLARALKGTPLAALLAGGADDPAQLEAALLGHLLARQHAAALEEPLGSAPVLWVLLRLQAQGLDLRRILWGAALGAPFTLSRDALVTPWS